MSARARKQYEIERQREEEYTNKVERILIPVVGRMEGLLSLYPECTDAPEALRMLAIARFEQGDLALAQDVARKLREDHPESLAVRRLERSHAVLAEGGMAEQPVVPEL